MRKDHHIGELGAYGFDVAHGELLVHFAPPTPPNHVVWLGRLDLQTPVGQLARDDDALAGLARHVPSQVLIGQEDKRVRA